MFTKLLAERMVRSFLAAATATLSINVMNADLSTQGAKALAVGAIASGVSACISLVSQFFGDPNSTSFTKVKIDNAGK